MYITRAKFVCPTPSQLFQLIPPPFALLPPPKAMSSRSNQNVSDEFEGAQEMYYWTQYLASKLVKHPKKFNFIELRPEVEAELDKKWNSPDLKLYHFYNMFGGLDVEGAEYFTWSDLQDLIFGLRNNNNTMLTKPMPQTGSDDHRVKMLQEMSGELLRRMDKIRKQMEKEKEKD